MGRYSQPLTFMHRKDGITPNNSTTQFPTKLCARTTETNIIYHIIKQNKCTMLCLR